MSLKEHKKLLLLRATISLSRFSLRFAQRNEHELQRTANEFAKECRI